MPLNRNRLAPKCVGESVVRIVLHDGFGTKTVLEHVRIVKEFATGGYLDDSLNLVDQSVDQPRTPCFL